MRIRDWLPVSKQISSNSLTQNLLLVVYRTEAADLTSNSHVKLRVQNTCLCLNEMLSGYIKICHLLCTACDRKCILVLA